MLTPDGKFGAIAPAGVFRVDEHDAVRVTRIPGVLGQARLQGGGLLRKRRKRWFGVQC